MDVNVNGKNIVQMLPQQINEEIAKLEAKTELTPAEQQKLRDLKILNENIQKELVGNQKKTIN